MEKLKHPPPIYPIGTLNFLPEIGSFAQPPHCKLSRDRK